MMRIYLSLMNGTIHLQPESVLNIPFQNYEKDFTFIVNEEKFQTCRIIADILSSKISKMHLIDPTLNEFKISIPEKGNFSNVLDLIKFNDVIIPESESLFILKILQILETESIDVCLLDQEVEITIDNVFDLIQKHEKLDAYYKDDLYKEIDFISEHFFEIDEEYKEGLEKISLETLSLIFENSKLHLKNEDQLLNIINYLYKKDPKYSTLYEYVVFSNVNPNEIDEFMQIFDVNDITRDTWQSIIKLLKQKLNTKSKPRKNIKRYSGMSKSKIPVLYEEKKRIQWNH